MSSSNGGVDLLIHNVHLCQDSPNADSTTLYDVACADGKVVSIEEASGVVKTEAVNVLDAGGKGLLVPGYVRSRVFLVDNTRVYQLNVHYYRLCHAHIHLDKCFLLDRCELKTG